MNDANESNVVVLIDYENVFIEFQKKFGYENQIDWEILLRAINHYGEIRICKAYSDWSGNWTIQDKFSSLGVRPINVPSKRRGRNGADVQITVDALDLMIIRNTDIANLVLISGDGDFTALANYLKENGKFVIGIGIEGSTAEYLVGACNEYYYLQLGGKLEDAKRDAPGQAQQQPDALSPALEPERKDDEPLELDNSGNVIESIVDKYIKILHHHKIQLAPTVDRHFIVKKIFYLLKKNGGNTLQQAAEKIKGNFSKNRPNIGLDYVSESIMHILKADCLVFDGGEDPAARDLSQWEKRIYLRRKFEKPVDLLYAVDRYFVEMILKEVRPEEIDFEALSKALYGTSQKAVLIRQLKQMVGKIAN